MLDTRALQEAVDRNGTIIRVVMAHVSGSTPRSAGTDMLVWESGQSGTIGGGQLEYQAARNARQMLKQAKPCRLQRVALGPSLGQCCGGAVTLVYDRIDRARLASIASEIQGHKWQRPVQASPGTKPDKILEADPCRTELIDGWLSEPVVRPPRSVCIYGSGHVARALAPILAGLPDTAVTVFDPREDEAAQMANTVPCITSLSWERAAASAPPNAMHFIMTPEHDVDLALCHQILSRGDFAYAGLIGSATKWARFRTRLAALGHPKVEIARIACPIGDPTLGKHPQAIAISVAAALLESDALNRAQGKRIA